MISKSWISGVTLVGMFTTQLLTTSAGQSVSLDVKNPSNGGKLDYSVVEATGHYNILQANEIIAEEDGTTSTNVHRITELGSGINYFDQETQKWQPALAEFEIDPKVGAVARHLYQQIQIAGDPSQPGAVVVTTPDLQELKSHIVGLALFDPATGAQQMIAELKKSPQGNLLGTKDKIAFADCFDSVHADLVYEITKGTFSQDIVLHQQVDPAVWKFPPNSLLEIWTEFDEASEPQKEIGIISQESDPDIRASMAEPDQVDESLAFGEVQFTHGWALPDGTVGPATASFGGVPVGKRFLTIDGRKFLVEGVSLKDLAPILKDLPKADKDEAVHYHQVREGRKALAQSVPKAARNLETKQLSLAKIIDHPAGIVLDYTTSIGSTNATLSAGTTYYLSSGAFVSGTLTIEGGAVVKYALGQYLQFTNVDCRTTGARPAIFTSKNDDSIGEIISGSTGNPLKGDGGNQALRVLNYLYTQLELHDLRLSYASYGIYFLRGATGATTNILRNIQITHTSDTPVMFYDALGGGRLLLYNVLIDTATNALYGRGVVMDGIHVTVNNATNLLLSYTSDCFLNLTNSLLAGVPTVSSYVSLSSSASYPSAASVFQTLGGGAVYNRSDVSNPCDTNGLPATLLADLKQRTVFPPTVLTNRITTDLTLSPSVARDRGATVAAGYHYWPLDYLMSGLAISNATLTLTNGLTLGWYGTNALQLSGSGKVVSQGSPTAKNYFVRYNSVQEQANTNWNSLINSLTQTDSSATTNAEVRLIFSELSLPGGVGGYFTSPNSPVTVRNSEIWGGNTAFGSFGTTNSLNAITNSLFYQTSTAFGTPSHTTASTLYLRNNLFKEGFLSFGPVGGNSWEWRDNVFDSVSLTQGIMPATNSHNAYTTNLVVLSNSLGNDLTNFIPNYQIGSLGYFYQASTSAVINVGSRSATNAGLFWFTTRTNQAIETNTVVDIGYHYIALNTSNQPFDNDGDGIPSYLEDANGNGVLDSGETDWTSATDLGLKVWITRPRNGSTIP